MAPRSTLQVMAEDKPGLRSSTEVLSRGFDPRLSVGSARPPVFRSSTYVFSSPEAAERAFDLVAGRAKPQAGEQPDLIYSRFNHPNAEILESQIVPLEKGAQFLTKCLLLGCISEIHDSFDLRHQGHIRQPPAAPGIIPCSSEFVRPRLLIGWRFAPQDFFYIPPPFKIPQ